MAVDPSAQIHPSSIVEEGAQIGAHVSIGPFCCIGPDVRLLDAVEIKSHVVITGDTTIGTETIVYPFSVIGEIPQDLKFKGEKTRLEIGARNRIREHVTINPGTEGGGGVTRVGDDCLLMAGCHVAHDARVGDRVILVNSVALAGHVVIEDDVIVGGLSGVHQWVRIGQGAIIGALTMVTNDVLPFGLVQGPRGKLDGLNLVGLKRRGVPREDITALRQTFQALSNPETSFMDTARNLSETATSSYVKDMLAFVLADSDRSFLTPG